MKIDVNTYGPGRPSLPQTIKTMEKMVELVQAEPGIPSAKLARKLGLDSLQCSTLAKRLAKQGILVIEKPNRALTYRIATDDGFKA